MKSIIVSLFWFALLSVSGAQTVKKGKKILISGTVTSTSNHCGGARPTDEIIAQLGTPKPVSGKKIYIKKGEENSPESKVIIVLTTDGEGKFHARLRPGKYFIVDETKKDASYYNMLLKTYALQTEHWEAIDQPCLQEWFSRPAAVFEVSEAAPKIITVNFHKTCEEIPCARYRGPFRE